MNKHILTVGLTLLCFTLCANAQDKFQSGYFLDNYAYSYRINPALLSEKSFFGLASSLEAGLSSDIGISTLLFPNADGTGLVTGLNKSISSEQFLGGLKDNNAFAFDGSVNVFSFGKRKEKGLTTVEINLRSDAAASIPYDFFRFLKEGSEESAYDLSGFNFGAKAYAELAVGYSKSFGSLTAGARVKALLGLANASLILNKALVTSNASVVSADLDAMAKLACAPVSLYNGENGDIAYKFDQSALRPSGYGAAVDLGVKWVPVKGLSLSAGISDLGAIKWTWNSLAKSTGSATYNGLSNVDTGTDFNEEIDNATKEFKNLINLQAVDGDETSLEKLSFTANAGARYALPFYRRLSAGVFGTYHFAEIAPYWDTRLGLTITPIDAISLTANCGKTRQGDVLGVAGSFSLFFLNVFFGLDTYVGKVGVYEIEGVNIPKYGGIPVPVDPFRMKFTFGANLQFGKRYKG